MILIIDNYDSFTYNVVQLVQTITNEDVQVVRNDALSIQDIQMMKPNRIILSPGPAHPKDSQVCLDIIQVCTETPILGICLGHQAIGHVFGAKILQQDEPKHGKVDTLYVGSEKSVLFKDIPKTLEIMRYHSLYIDEQSLGSDFKITGRSTDGVIQAIEHKTRPLYGVQFHPESYFSNYGKEMIENFLRSETGC